MSNNINKVDPLKKQEEVQSLNNGAMSPMSPPDAYEAAIPESITDKEDSQLITDLREEHIEFKEYIARFLEALHYIKENKSFNSEATQKISAFFQYFDKEFVIHNKKEERYLFPILTKRLIENGEHSVGIGEMTTPVDILESEHLQALQLGAIISNTFETLPRIKDQESYNILLATAVNKGFILAELLNLHIYREDSIVFTLAKNYLTEEDLKIIHRSYSDC